MPRTLSGRLECLERVSPLAVSSSSLLAVRALVSWAALWFVGSYQEYKRGIRLVAL